jgi:Prolyl oligopeptidase family
MRRAFRGGGIVFGILLALSLVPCARGQQRYRAVKDPASPPDIPYTRYFTTDKFKRRITFYISGDQSQRLPIVLSVLGSGAYSNFVRENGKIYDGHRAAREAFDGKAHILIVEKPGIDFLEQHGPHGNPNGSEGGASPEFLRENTLPRWAEAVNAALRAGRTLPMADPSRCLVIGHSEGGIVVAMVAAENQFVTHIASLSAPGPTLLYQLTIDAREGHLYRSLPPDAETQMRQLRSDVAAVLADPDSTTKLVLGHSHLYWSSRWPYSEMEILSHAKARIFLAHGSADHDVAVANFDVMYAQLLAAGRDVTAHRYEGADHGYRFADQPGRDGWKEVFETVRDWFFE